MLWILSWRKQVSALLSGVCSLVHYLRYFSFVAILFFIERLEFFNVYVLQNIIGNWRPLCLFVCSNLRKLHTK